MMTTGPAFPGSSPQAYPVEEAAFSGGAPGNMQMAVQRGRILQALARSNPNLVRSMPNVPVDYLPHG